MKLYLENLENSPERSLIFKFNEKIEELGNDFPVIGELTAISNGLTVEIKGHVETDFTFECDRCLKEYSSHLVVDIDENFVKGTVIDSSHSEIELKENSFIEELGDADEIDLTDLVYQSIILNLPNKKLCDINCKGSEESKLSKEENQTDPRLQIFKDMTDNIK